MSDPESFLKAVKRANGTAWTSGTAVGVTLTPWGAGEKGVTENEHVAQEVRRAFELLAMVPGATIVTGNISPHAVILVAQIDNEDLGWVDDLDECLECE